MRKITMLSGAAAATVLVIGGLTISAAGGTPVRVLRFYEHDTQDVSLDLGAQGDSPGDHYVYSGDLFDRKGGKKLGRVGGDCETLSTIAAHPETLCNVNFILAGGEITGVGTFNTPDLFGGGKTLTFPLTGGTGVYRNVHGWGTVQVPPDVPNYADANWVLHRS
jgi:hypothetical protein